MPRNSGGALPPPERGRVGVGVDGALGTPTRTRSRCCRAQFADLRSDDFQHTIEVFSDIGIPEAQHRHAVLLQPFITFAVARPGRSVLAAIEFDSESQCGTIEVEDVAAGWMLAAKRRVAELTMPQPLPQPPFDVGSIAPQSAGEFGFCGRAVEAGHLRIIIRFSASRGPPPRPSPFQGEGAHRP